MTRQSPGTGGGRVESSDAHKEEAEATTVHPLCPPKSSNAIGVDPPVFSVSLWRFSTTTAAREKNRSLSKFGWRVALNIAPSSDPAHLPGARMTTSTDHAALLVAALSNLSRAERRAFLEWLSPRLQIDSDHHRAVWHGLASLTAQVDSDQRNALDALELALDGDEIGAIIPDTNGEGAA